MFTCHHADLGLPLPLCLLLLFLGTLQTRYIFTPKHIGVCFLKLSLFLCMTTVRIKLNH